MEVFHLRVESLLSPDGIDVSTPRFSWLLKDSIKQKAYQIVCKSEGATIWDSGKINSDQISFIPYEGPVLKSRDIVSLTVTSWNEKDETGTASASFEMGLLNKEDWKAKWIKGDYEPEEGVAYPVDCFLKEYKLKGQVKKARLYITSFGIYEARINGIKAGDMVLQPGVDNYNKILHYQTFDVASLLKEENRLTVELSDGYYRGSVGYQGLLGVYGNIDAFLYQLEIEYEDGTKDAVCSDKTWKWSNDGPILFADMKDGEDVDLNKEPSYKGEAVEVEKNIVPSASNNGAMKEKDVFKGEVSVKENNLVVYDFKQNLAGFLHLKIKGRKGQKIKITLAETTDEKGHADFQFQGTLTMTTDGVAQIESYEKLRLVCGNSVIQLEHDSITITAPVIKVKGKSAVGIEGDGPSINLEKEAQIVADNQLNVRQTEALCKKLAKPPKEAKEPEPRGTLPVEVDESLKQVLGSEVNVAYHGGKGKLTVHFYSDEQLRAFANLLGQYQTEE